VKFDDWVSFALLEEKCPLLYCHVHLLHVFFNEGGMPLLWVHIASTTSCVSNILGLFGKKANYTLIVSVLAIMISLRFPELFIV